MIAIAQLTAEKSITSLQSRGCCDFQQPAGVRLEHAQSAIKDVELPKMFRFEEAAIDGMSGHSELVS